MKLKINWFILSPSPAWDPIGPNNKYNICAINCIDRFDSLFCSQFIQHACDVLLLCLHSRAAQTRTQIVHKHSKVLSVFRFPSCYGNMYNVHMYSMEKINQQRADANTPVLRFSDQKSKLHVRRSDIILSIKCFYH